MGTCKLVRRSGTAQLAAAAVAGAPGAEAELLTAPSLAGGDGDWRVIDLWSDEDSPWVARVVWSGGGGAQRTALMDVPKATRVCVHATMIQIFGSNLSASRVVNARTAIADGQCETENQLTVRGSSGSGGGVAEIAPPPWARFFRLELSDSSSQTTTFIDMCDANGTARGRYPADKQPSSGLPIGDAATIRCTFPAGGLAYRLVFLLHL